MSEKSQREIDLEMVRKHLEALSEHFDTVQIFCTRYNPNRIEEADEEGTTTRLQVGQGNWFARYGQVRYWLQMQDAVAAKEGVEP
jgi:hypothetical protein